MCGIFAVRLKNAHEDAGEMVLAGLKRLEYRGYDSWGIAVTAKEKIEVEKHVGKISGVNKLSLPESLVAIGHTRWATHGGVTQKNAHPHAASDGSFVLAQNGVVQNFDSLKEELIKKGYTFISETDTEVIVRLVEEWQKTLGDLQQAVRQAFLQLEGRNTIIVLTQEGKIIAARNGSPLLIGLNSQTGNIFFSSDTLSFADEVTEVVIIDNGQIVTSWQDQLEVTDAQTGKRVEYVIEPLTVTSAKIDKEGFPHFMIKEIHESPQVILKVSESNESKLSEVAEVIKSAKHVYTIGSGTAGIAAAQIAFYLRKFGRIPAVSLVGADATEYFELFNEGDMIIAPSQSGETADVLEVLEIAKKKKMKIVTFVNMPGSSMTRIADFSFLAEAGPEICVMSTKVFVSQLAWGYLIAKTVQGKHKEGQQNLTHLAATAKKYLESPETEKSLTKLTEKSLAKKDLFLLGKAQNFQVIREGMVKIIEGTYKHAHALPAGDLKHYAITLMEKYVPVMVVFSNDDVKADTFTAAEQVKARGAHVIGVGPEKHHVFDEFIQVPDTGETAAILNVLPLQLYAYYMTVRLGHDVDHPRNIAKSVTVK